MLKKCQQRALLYIYIVDTNQFNSGKEGILGCKLWWNPKYYIQHVLSLLSFKTMGTFYIYWLVGSNWKCSNFITIIFIIQKWYFCLLSIDVCFSNIFPSPNISRLSKISVIQTNLKLVYVDFTLSDLESIRHKCDGR